MSSNAGERDVARRMGFGRPRPKLQVAPSEARISSGKTLLETLGIRSGMKTALVGVSDPQVKPTDSYSAFRSTASIPLRPVDVVVYQAESTFALRRIRELVPLVKQGGALWVLWPRSQSHITDNHVQRSGLAAGMIDVGAVTVSDRLTGLKFVHGHQTW